MRNKDLPTDAALALRQPHADGRETTWRDFGVPGLLLRIGRRKRRWELRIEGKTKAYRSLGEWPQKPAKVAVEEARKIRERAKAGKPLDDAAQSEATIADMWPLYKARLIDENASPRTLVAYEQCYARLSEAIRHRAMRDLLAHRTLMAEEQARIRSRLANHRRGGLAAAAQSAVFVSALFTFARDRDPSLIGDPISACQTALPQNKDLAILAVEDMPEWWRKVQKLRNPIVREALLFTLLSGLRRSSLEALKWSDLDLKRGCLRVAVAKGGKAFDLILSRPMIRCLWRARHAGRVLFPEQAKVWVFPGECGHLTGNSLTKYPGVVANHALRRAYATAAQLAGVDEPTVGRLLNHGGKSVTARYIRDSHLGKMLASAQADISAYIVKALDN